jgi:GNAT superfamily N-acetyltransferase
VLAGEESEANAASCERLSGFNIRRSGPGDLEAIVSMRIEFERAIRDSGSLDEDARRRELRSLFGRDLSSGELLAWLAEEDGRPIAEAALRLRGDSGELLNVYTAPAFRRRGLGSALVDEAIAEADKLGLRRVTLQPTEDSRRIYERRGFRGGSRSMSLVLPRPPAPSV